MALGGIPLDCHDVGKVLGEGVWGVVKHPNLDGKLTPCNPEPSEAPKLEGFRLVEVFFLKICFDFVHLLIVGFLGGGCSRGGVTGEP